MRPKTTCVDQVEFAEALRLRRLQLGLTQADLDHLAGFHDGYTAHLESPFSRSGRKSFKLSRMGVIWLDALGLELRICQRTEPTQAGALVANDDYPTIEVGTHQRLPAQRIG